MVKIALPVQGAQVPSLVKELRSYVPGGKRVHRNGEKSEVF